ncbi:MAG TPA: stage V sporulation protein AD [Firmicutes bacterium]|nr:stage V sporulation protein AD [Bacillota bacterium]
MIMEKKAVLAAAATVAGPKEGSGPLAEHYDRIYPDNLLKEGSFEKAERRMLEETCFLALGKLGLSPDDIDFFIAGDLLNQIISSSFCARKLALPFLGIYGACSSLVEGLSLGAMLLEGNFAGRILVATSSHNCSSERQYRYPTEYGFQRPGYSQQTVTGAGAVVLGSSLEEGPRIESITIGKVVDPEIKDPYNMGMAMAPAAADTIYRHLTDLGRDADYYQLILTGDLGEVGKQLNEDILARKGLNLLNYTDCGIQLYYPHQKVHAGASGCACCALFFLGKVYKDMLEKRLGRVLFVATGALHSTTTYQQGESIPAIAHAVALEI